MTNEVDLFADEQSEREPTPAAAGGAPRRKKKKSVFQDPVVRWMAIGAVSVVILWVAAMASAIVFGLTDPPAPRTFVEQRLYMLEGVVKSNPQSGLAWRDYAAALISAKQYSAAQRVIEDGMKVAKEKSYLMVQEARLAREKGDDDKALELAAKAAKEARKEREADVKRLEKSGSSSRIVPKGLSGALIITGEILTERKDWEGVIEACDERLELEPTDTKGLVMRGNAYAGLGDKKKAEKDFREALEYVPDMPEALAGLKAIGADEQ